MNEATRFHEKATLVKGMLHLFLPRRRGDGLGYRTGSDHASIRTPGGLDRSRCTLRVDDLAAAVAWLGQRGVRFTPGGIRKGAAGHEVCFIHPKGSEGAPVGGEGVLIELVQAPPEVVAAFRGRAPD